MLTWTQRPDGWYSDGLRIELAAPSRWLLLDNEGSVAPVAIPEQPLAVARSLTECKREAELLMARRRRSDTRRHHVMTLLLVVTATLLLLGPSGNVNAVIVIVAMALGTRSVTILLGTLLPKALGEQHEVFYQ